MKNVNISPQLGNWKWFNRPSRGIVVVLFTVVVIFCIGAGPYPEPLTTSKDILAAKSTLDSIDIWHLPLVDFPLLSRFKGLKSVRLWSKDGTFATDEKLKALSDIGFTNLTYINLNNSYLVTDKGIEALSQIHSLRQLTLERTAITDAGCNVMATRMALDFLNLANCPGVTMKGLEPLARSKTLNYFSFSSDQLTQGEVMSLVDSFKRITWCEVVDTKGILDSGAIKAKSKKLGIHVSVRPTGALQEMKLYDGKF